MRYFWLLHLTTLAEGAHRGVSRTQLGSPRRRQGGAWGVEASRGPALPSFFAYVQFLTWNLMGAY